MSIREVIDEMIEPARTIADVLPADCDIIEEEAEFDAISVRFLSRGLPSERPVLMNVSGLPAAGKSRYVQTLLCSRPDFVSISFDAIMEACRGYRNDWTRDRRLAFSRWELPARVAGYRLLEQCIDRRFSVIFEHSNALAGHLALYEAIRRQGYEIEIHFIGATPELVLPRLAGRNRYFPESLVEERWHTIQTWLPEYRRISDRFVEVIPWRG